MMEVGIEECLHIEFEYERTKYHLQDVIKGKIHFRLVRLKIKYMELCLVKRESTGTAPNVYHENSNITKFEIMDGAPVKGFLLIFFFSVSVRGGYSGEVVAWSVSFITYL